MSGEEKYCEQVLNRASKSETDKRHHHFLVVIYAKKSKYFDSFIHTHTHSHSSMLSFGSFSTISLSLSRFGPRSMCAYVLNILQISMQ